MQKEIPNIQPYNDVFYKTCMYNPLLTAVYYFGGNVLPFLANDIFMYGYNSEKGFKVHNINNTIKPEFKLINELGISTDNNICVDNFVNDIKDAINNKMLVYVPIDRFYWSAEINKWYFQVRHHPHFFLVYGYDDSNEKFSIIDVTNDNCCKSFIDYQNLLECYMGWSEWKGEKSLKITRIYISNEDCIKSEDCSIEKNKMIFRRNMDNTKAEIFAGLDNIKMAVDYYSSIEPDMLCEVHTNSA